MSRCCEFSFRRPRAARAPAMAQRAPCEWCSVYLVIPVKNTFVHFSVPDDRQRSHSAPPGLCVAIVRPPPKRHAKRRQLRKRWRDDDANALTEYRRIAKEEKWRQIVTKTLEEDRARDRAVAKTMAKVNNIEIFTPKLRESLDARVFRRMQRAVFNDQRDVATLKRLGVIREKGGHVEFWCADVLLMQTTMQALLGEARRYRLMQFPRSSVTRVWI